jgi:hypothetical protein
VVSPNTTISKLTGPWQRESSRVQPEPCAWIV